MGPKSIEDIYTDFKFRRDAVINALTTEVEDFFELCDPARENLCLYGFSDGTWRVDVPAAEVPPELPEPVLGINFARDGMERKDWLALCAVHSDAWLMSVIFFYAARFDDDGRAELFSLVNQHPTVYEVVTGRCARNKVHKRKQLVGSRAATQQAPAAKRQQQQPQQQQEQLQQQPQQLQQAQFPQELPTESSVRTGRLVVPADISAALVGRQGELYWPDDSLWYLVQVVHLDLKTRQATVQYATGEEETMNIDEVVGERQMSLLE